MIKEYGASYKIDRYHPAFKHLRFVAVAVSSDETRMGMNYLKVEKNKIIATDGRRLHMVEIDPPVEPGLYEVIKNNTRDIVIARDDNPKTEYPNYDRVIPTDSAIYSCTFDGIRNLKRKPRDFAKVSQMMYLFPEPTTFNLKYVEDIGFGPWRVEWRGASKGLVFRTTERMALIMPMQIH